MADIVLSARPKVLRGITCSL